MITITPQSHASGSLTVKAAVAQAVKLATPPLPGQGYMWGLPTILIEAGSYAVNPGDLNPIAPEGSWSVLGLNIIGEGYGAVQFVMNDLTGVPLFNDVDLAAKVTLQNIDFIGTTGKEQCLHFASFLGRVYDMRLLDCSFINFAKAVSFAGEVDTSESKIDRCSFVTPAGGFGITLNNPQSVDHWWREISVEGWGIWLQVLRGGVIDITGLECSLFGGHLIDIGPANAQMGQNNDGIVIRGFKTDPLPAGSLLVNNNGSMNVHFKSGNFNPPGTKGNYVNSGTGSVSFSPFPACIGVNG